MGKDSAKNIDWEPDVRKGMEDMRGIKDIKQGLKNDADGRKIDGSSPGDLGLNK